MRTLLILAFIATVSGGRTCLAEDESAPHATADGRAVVREINLARQHPEIYAEHLQEQRAYFRGKMLVLPGETILRTREGVGAVDEAIRFLRRTRPLEPLAFSTGLALAAADHVADQASGAVGHNGSHHSRPGDRISRHGTWSGRWGENISYGQTNARAIVLALIVDDGLRGRQHRHIIFSQAFHYAGAALGAHARYGRSCSIDFAAGYVEKGAGLGSLVAGN